ncbi:MAG TPA: hypothetical protein VGR26_01410 [Acidimicrobiales bacterium]|nr:hypothetical protein [Acidimicrobiales bacterium]
MPTRPDKGQTEKQGSGKTGGQKAAYGSARSPEVAEGAAEPRRREPDDHPEDDHR